MGISTHTLTWSVTVFPKPNHYIINHFNSHAHVERDIAKLEMQLADKNFNSHAHVERDKKLLYNLFGFAISTHTLTWSVTFLSSSTLSRKRISTHTLTWSVTVRRTRSPTFL